MVTKRVMHATATNFWDEPSTTELVFIIMNYTLSVPVLIAVGFFSLFHFHALLTNTTTIESWEKDKVATLVRRGKIQEIKFPYTSVVVLAYGTASLSLAAPISSSVSNAVLIPSLIVDPEALAWPPQIENLHAPPDVDPNFEFKLPESPWTYNNGTLNPTLEAHNAQNPAARRRRPFVNKEAVSSVPPYHPHYGEDDGSDRLSVSSSSSSEDGALVRKQGPRRLVRRGSEGYEVRAIDREALLRQHVEDQMHEPGRYNVYVPDPITPNESGSETEDEEVPLVQRVEEWRASSASGGSN
ncbi:hypothetical protein EIP86_007746 [Pleurotus ostreatoroseus]|nr:hypothetical protein EIP86_007746 [Pleurotus ostreatoroseus]